MKIGLIIYGSLETVSGGYLYDRKLVDYLRAQGDTVEIISQLWSSYGRHLGHNFSSDMLSRLRESQFDMLLQDELNHPYLHWGFDDLIYMSARRYWEDAGRPVPQQVLCHWGGVWHWLRGSRCWRLHWR